MQRREAQQNQVDKDGHHTHDSNSCLLQEKHRIRNPLKKLKSLHADIVVTQKVERIQNFLKCESESSSLKNKKVLSPFYYKKIFLIENECKTPIGCLTFIFYQKYFYDKIDLFSRDEFYKKLRQKNAKLL